MENATHTAREITGLEILKESMLFFSAHSFTDKDGYQITGISHLMIQLRKGDDVHTFTLKNTPKGFHAAMAEKYTVQPE